MAPRAKNACIPLTARRRWRSTMRSGTGGSCQEGPSRSAGVPSADWPVPIVEEWTRASMRAPERGGALDHDPHAAPADHARGRTRSRRRGLHARARRPRRAAPTPAATPRSFRTPPCLPAAKAEGTLTHHRAPARLVQLRVARADGRPSSTLQGADRPRGQRARPRTPAPATRSRPSRPTRTTRARRRRTSSTSASASAPRPRPRGSPAVQGRDLGLDPGRLQGRRRLLVRRLLRRPVVRGEQGRHHERARRTGRTCSSPSTRTRSRSRATR